MFFTIVDHVSNDFEKMPSETREKYVLSNPNALGGVLILQDSCRTICPLYVAIINHDQNSVRRLLQKVDPSAVYYTGVHPSFRHGRNWSYLSYALHEQYMPVVRILLEDIRVVRSIYKQQYQVLRWCLDEERYLDFLPLIVKVLSLDSNVPMPEDVERITTSMNRFYQRNSKVINEQIFKNAPIWLKDIAHITCAIQT